MKGEVVSGFRGGVRKTVATVSPKGAVTSQVIGNYPRGIQRRVSPNGAAYQPLKGSTMRMRSLNPKSLHPTNPSFILRDTEEMYRSVGAVRSGDTVFLEFATAEQDKKSEFQEHGGSHKMKLRRNKKGQLSATGRTFQSVDVDIPARPHRKMQPAVKDTIRTAIRRWFLRG